MDFPETLKSGRALRLGGAAALILIAVILLWRNRGPSATAPDRAFFTTDDGKTWFVDSSEKLPPFDRDGKTACRAYLFTCDGGRTKFVGYMERFADSHRQQAQAATGGKPRSPDQITTAGPAAGLEVKRPGDKEWVPRAHPKGAEVLGRVRCPDGSITNLQPVLP